MLCLQAQKEFKFKLILLDNREFKFSYKGLQKCEQILIDVAKILNLEEKEYFGFRYIDSDLQSKWLDLNKTIQSQFKTLFVSENHEIVIHFCVKFYLTDPCKLTQELTRYLFYLQLRKDILQGKLFVKFDFAVDLFSYFLQDELGDFNPKRDVHGYASQFEFMPNQSIELEKAAEAKHMKLKGMNQETCEMNFLNKAKWLDMYGVDLHSVKNDQDIDFKIGLTPTGITVFQENVKINSYFWPRINKLNYKGNKFILSVIDKSNQETIQTFYLNTKYICKNLWKSCVDQYNFFKIKSVYDKPAMINTTSAMSKKSNKSSVGSSESNSINKVVFRRVPAKRKMMPQVNSNLNLKEIDLNEVEKKNEIDNKIVNENGDLIFNKNTNDVNDSDLFTPKRNVLNNVTNFNKSPTMSSKSIASYKYSSNVRRESASESEFGGRRKNGSRNRSRNRRTYNDENENNPKQSGSNDTESDNNHEKNNLIVRSNSNRSNRSNKSTKSNRSNKSRRHHHRSESKSSNKVVYTVDHYVGNEIKYGVSKKMLSDHQSGANLIKKYFDGSETCHETEQEEVNDINELEKKRQIRRRKRSKSPGGTTKPPDEILQHIKYDLIQTSGLSSDQLREIPFVKVETTAPPFRISPHQKHRRVSPHRRRSGGDFYDSKSSLAYVRDGTAQIKKLTENNDFKMANAAIVTTGSAINSKLNCKTIAVEPSTNIGFSADSGCEDMIITTNANAQSS